MMRALVDFEVLRSPNCGLGYYSLGLGRALAAEQGPDLRLTYFLRRPQASCFADTNVDLAFATDLRRETYCQALRPLLRHIYRERYDLWHMTNQNAKFWPLDPSVPMLLTIHDLNFLRERDPSEHAHELAKLQKKINRAAAIATDSHFVEQELREHLDLHGKPVRVIYCGLTLSVEETPTRPAYLPEGPFLFTIGEVVPKKNVHVLLDLVAGLPGHCLVIAGRKSHDYAGWVERQIQERGLGSRVFVPGQISGSERLWLYQNCQAFCFPSITEGFGLPVIEAMAAGRPVFMSHVTSLPEIGGDLGFYWHAYDAEHLRRVYDAGMERARNTPDFARQLQQHAAQFSWRNAALQYIELYREVAGEQSQRRAA